MFVRILANVKILIVHDYSSSKKELCMEVTGMDKGGNGEWWGWRMVGMKKLTKGREGSN